MRERHAICNKINEFFEKIKFLKIFFWMEMVEKYFKKFFQVEFFL